MRTCYYELLDVQPHADDVELKKAYRRKALQYHPDKNPDSVEESTEIFATIRAAYEVLSDPQERAWYDSHKQQILSDEPIGAGQDGDYEYEVDSSVTGVTTDELLMFFNSALYTRMDDSPAGFYQIAGKVFAKLAKDEVYNGRRLGLGKFNLYQDDFFETNINSEGYLQACSKYAENYQKSSDSMLFPPFGSSATSYEYLKAFYRKWSEFSSLKSFSWKDEYMYSRNYDRRTKREVNKRNEKARQQARSEYNKTVKRFVAFIKKLDRRMKEGAKKAEELKREKARQKQKELKDAYLADRRTKLASEFELQGWQAVDENNFEEMEKLYASNSDDQTNLSASDKEEEEIVVYDCFLCNKRFKSEKQLENHCNTKMHKRKVAEVRKEMKEQSMTLGLDDLSEVEDFDSADEQPYESEKQAEPQADDDEGEQNDEDEGDSALDSITEELAKIEEQLAQMTAELSEDSESEESENEGRDRILDDLLASLNSEGGTDEVDWHDKRATTNAKSKKTSPKRENVRGKCQQNGFSQTQVCATCNERFDSRNKLFKHVHSSGHVALRGQLRPDVRSSKKIKNSRNSRKGGK
ncbi:hypothetical protein HG536_0D00330 [Torulaspora globosa]|uniref:J domain-containing protein n=1 Tax=Torulaspora globosa TaxID=48254 RepID=A0A7G3ZG75_9SACH|nr:uncharacterized protein HG536_0D00330 [Torulaspora globosa]QLL32511.1 hypothetical protein HG536_0D00330 [Torulaspora globosa]